MGRPTSYKPEYCDELIEYFESHILYTTEVKEKGTRKGGGEYTIYEKIANDYPTLNDFAKKINVSRSSINEWDKHHPEFSAALKEAKELQANILVNGGLKGVYVPSVAIFALKNVAGWRDDRFVLDQSEHTHLTIVTKDENGKASPNRINGQAEFSLPKIDG